MHLKKVHMTQKYTTIQIFSKKSKTELAPSQRRLHFLSFIRRQLFPFSKQETNVASTAAGSFPPFK